MSYEKPLLMPEHVKKRLLALDFQPRTVLDIGAYEGYWSKDIKTLFPSCQPFMIEGDKDKNDKLKACEIPYEIALLSDEKKSATFYKSHSIYTTGNSIYREDSIYFKGDHYHTEQVHTITLKEIVEKRDIKDIDMIKLDVQGSEKDIMMGGLDIVRNCKVIFIEMSITEYNIGSPSFTEVNNFLDQIGFQLIDIVDFHYTTDGKKLLYFDAIYMKK